jgi:SUMO ligase MMS21 Smc5/6 complex component
MNTRFVKLSLLFSALISQKAYTMESPEVVYLIKEEHANQCDDRKREIFVKTPLFMALCINASRDTQRSKHHFEKLLAAMRSETIPATHQEVTLTQKEFFAGLIAHVAYLNDYLEDQHGAVFAVAINGKKTYLQFGPNMWNPNNISAAQYENMPAEELAALTLKYKSLLTKYSKKS